MHLLARNEIEELRRELKSGDDEMDARIDVLCEMALAQLERTLSEIKSVERRGSSQR